MKKLFLFIFITIFFTHLHGYLAFVNKPVINLLGKPSKHYGGLSIYTEMPYSFGASIKSCPRLFQLPLGYIVTVIKEEGEESLIEINILYGNEEHLSNYYWTLTANLTPIKNIPIKIRIALLEPTHKNSRFLMIPFHDKSTKIDFSAGTLFALAPNQQSSTTTNLFFYNSQTSLWETIQIPNEYLFSQTDDHRKDFITILRSWELNSEGKIPLAWGGGCPAYRIPNSPDAVKLKNDQYIESSSDTPHSIRAGLDTSGAEVVAARIANIPFFWRNTSTIRKYLTPLQQGERLKTGDIVYFEVPTPYTCVVDCANNTLIGARSYDSGWGNGNLILKINQMFKEIATYQQLEEAYFNGTKLTFISSSHGKITTPVKNLTLLKLPERLTPEEKQALLRSLIPQPFQDAPLNPFI